MPVSNVVQLVAVATVLATGLMPTTAMTGSNMGNALAAPTSSYLTTSGGAGTPVTTPGNRALPVVQGAPAYPHSGGAALHAQGYGYQKGKAPLSSSVPFPPQYIVPGGPVPIGAPSVGSFVEESGKAFPPSGIGDHNYYLNTIYPNPHATWHSHSDWQSHPMWPPHPNVQPHAYVNKVEHHTIHHHVVHYHPEVNNLANPVILPTQPVAPSVVPPMIPTAFIQAKPKKKPGPSNQAYPMHDYPFYPHHSAYHILQHPITNDPTHLVTVYPPIYHDTSKMPFVPKDSSSPVQIVEQHVVHHHLMSPPILHNHIAPGIHYVPPTTSFLQKDLPKWITPPSPKYRFGAGVPLTPVNGQAESTVHALLPGVTTNGGEVATMYGTNSPKTFDDPHPPAGGQPQHWSHQSSLANPMYQQTNPMGSNLQKAPEVPKYSAVKR